MGEKFAMLDDSLAKLEKLISSQEVLSINFNEIWIELRQLRTLAQKVEVVYKKEHSIWEKVEIATRFLDTIIELIPLIIEIVTLLSDKPEKVSLEDRSNVVKQLITLQVNLKNLVEDIVKIK